MKNKLIKIINWLFSENEDFNQYTDDQINKIW